MKQLVALAGLILLMTGCKKPEDRTCWKSWGEETTREIQVESFTKLRLAEHMEYVLIQDSLNKIVVTAGKNMVNLVNAEMNEEGFLLVEQKNKCRFLRNKKKVIHVEIHFTELDEIYYIGTETLTNVDTLQVGWFSLQIQDGAGPVNLKVHADMFSGNVGYGCGDFTVSGTANFARVGAKSSGYCDATGLICQDSLFVYSETSAPIKVNANNLVLKGYLKSRGNIYYTGNPLGIDILNTGYGQVLPL